MVTRTNGAPRQGVWFSADVRLVTITVTNATFLADLTVPAGAATDRQADAVNSSLEVCLEAIAARGNVIGLTVIDATNLVAMVDYAQAYDPANEGLGGQAVIDVEAEVIAAISSHESATSETGLDLTCTALTILEGFAGNALGTPS